MNELEIRAAIKAVDEALARWATDNNQRQALYGARDHLEIKLKAFMLRKGLHT
jgi:hypothetical protein